MSSKESNERTFHRFLERHRSSNRRQAHDGRVESYTHLRLPDEYRSGGSFNIPVTSMLEFYILYAKACSETNGHRMHILEGNDRTTPLKIDLDLSFPVSQTNVSQAAAAAANRRSPSKAVSSYITNTHIDSLVASVVQTLDQWCEARTMRVWTESDLTCSSTDSPDLPYNPRYGVVFQRGSPCLGKNGTHCKDGLHIIFPELVTSSLSQFIVRGTVVEAMKAVYKKSKHQAPASIGATKESVNNIEASLDPCADLLSRLANGNVAIEDMYDSAVINRNAWMMYGSDKVGKADNPYGIIRVVHVDQNGVTHTESPSEYIARIKNCLPTLKDIALTEQEKEYLAISYHLRMRAYGQPRPIVRLRPDFSEGPAFKTLLANKHIPVPKVDHFQNINNNDKPFTRYPYVRELVSKCLSTERAASETGWWRVGFALSNLASSGKENPDEQSLLEAWIDWSKRPPQYTHSADTQCRGKWQYFQRGRRGCGLGLPSLEECARRDNPEEFQKIQKKYMQQQLVKSTNCNDYDIALLVVNTNNNSQHFRCSEIGGKVWYTYNTDTGLWSMDRGCNPLQLQIPEHIYPMLKASIYEDQRQKTRALDDSPEEEDLKQPKRAEIQKYTAQAVKKINILRQNGKMSAASAIVAHKLYDNQFKNNVDQNLDIVSLAGGDVYDLKEGCVRHARPSDMLTKSTGQFFYPEGMRPDEDGAASKVSEKKEVSISSTMDDSVYHMNHPQVQAFLGFMSDIFPDKEVQHYMEKVLSSHFDGHTRDETFHVFIGTGANGKSKLQSLMSMILGDYFAIASIKIFTGGRADASSATAQYEAIKNKRSVWVQEPEQNERMNSGVLKELTGGDKIYSRGLYQSGDMFKPQAKFTLVSNYKPKVSAEDAALWRRIRCVRFPMKFVANPDPTNPFEKKRDISLDEKLKAMAGAAQWYLLTKAYPLYLKEGISDNSQIPEAIYKETRSYREEYDEIADFISRHMNTVEAPEDIDDIRMEVCTEELSQRFTRFVESRRPRSVYIRYAGNTERIVELFSKRSKKWGEPKSLGDGRNGWPQWCWKPTVANTSVW